MNSLKNNKCQAEPVEAPVEAPIEALNLFYEEPDPDRWVKYDRYPRKLIRRIIRGKQKPGGVMSIALSLMQGLEQLGQPYRFNDYRHISNHPNEIACIIGKPHVLEKRDWKNPLIFGAGIFSHPVDFPGLLEKYPSIKKILVPGPWMKEVFDPFYGANRVESWPAGIDTEKWSPAIKNNLPKTDFLIYDKVRWQHPRYEDELINPLISVLKDQHLSCDYIRYGLYTHAILMDKLADVKAVIFLCEHETQGQAYQQILATGTPILAWDRGGFWQDPAYYPDRVLVGPVSSVPYWDERCGMKFSSASDFQEKLLLFTKQLVNEGFSPREYILENLSLEKSTRAYLKIYREVMESMT